MSRNSVLKVTASLVLKMPTRGFLILFRFVLIGSFTATAFAAEEVQQGPDSVVSLHIGNESNTPDSILGPFTYGLTANHAFEKGWSLSGGVILLREPDTAFKASVLDEAQLSIAPPQLKAFDLPSSLTFTLWKNRTIDMYTQVAGLEFEAKNSWTTLVGAYGGEATRYDIKQGYAGIQVALSHTIGPFEFSAAHIEGAMGKGSYRKSAVEMETSLFDSSRFPLQVHLSLEDRYFDFGGDGPKSSTDDELIAILGIDVHLEKLLFRSIYQDKDTP